MTDITPYVNGTQFGTGYHDLQQVGATNLYRALIRMNWGDVVVTPFGHPRPFGPGFVRTGRAVVEPRIITGEVLSVWKSTNPERALRDEANDDLPVIFCPHGDEFTLRVDRLDSGGAATSRYLTCEMVSMPDAFTPDMAHYVSGYAWMRWPFALRAAFPYWRDVTATTQDVTLTNKDADETNTISWTQINNVGADSCGVKFTVQSISAGTLTTLTLSNTDTSETATWSDGTALAASDELDFFVDDPSVCDWTAGNTLTVTSSMSLRRGTNDGTIYGQGSSSPAAVVRMTYTPYWKGF